MNHEWNEPAKVEITDSNWTLDNWLNKPYVDQNLRNQLQRANVLIVPIDSFGDYDKPLFPDGTQEVYQYLLEHATHEMRVEVAITDDDFKELALHSDLVSIGTFVVTNLLAPAVANLLSDYIKSRWTKRTRIHNKTLSSDRSVSATIILISSTGESKCISYNGPDTEFAEQMVPLINKLTTSTATEEHQ